jgi:hypothetical protein
MLDKAIGVEGHEFLRFPQTELRSLQNTFTSDMVWYFEEIRPSTMAGGRNLKY